MFDFDTQTVNLSENNQQLQGNTASDPLDPTQASFITNPVYTPSSGGSEVDFGVVPQEILAQDAIADFVLADDTAVNSRIQAVSSPSAQVARDHSTQNLLQQGIDPLTNKPLTDEPKFRVIGNTIYDPNGQEFIAKGVNVNGPGFGWPGTTPEYADKIVDWGFNTVRVNVRELDPAPWLYDENGTIDEIVEAYTSKGLVVMLDAHENLGKFTEGQDIERIEKFFSNLAEKYKDNPYVWFNPYNEPGAFGSHEPENAQKWITQNERAVKAIRDTGNDNPIVLDTWYWGQDQGTWNTNAINPNRSALLSGAAKDVLDINGEQQYNVVFSSHFYEQYDYPNKVEQYFDMVEATGLPFIIGEYGAQKSGDLKSVVERVLSKAQEDEVGRIAWAWWGGDNFELTTSGNGGGQNTQFNAQGNPTNLTWFGQQVWQDNRRAENLHSIDLQNPPIPSDGSGGSGGSGSDNPAPNPQPQPGTMTIEAEKMSLSGYKIESNPDASSQSLISLLNGGSNGSAQTKFSGATAGYQIKVGYFDENDGKAELAVSVNGQERDRWTLDQQLGNSAATSSTATEHTVDAVWLNSGDTIKIEGLRDKEEYARVDYIKLVPTDTVSQPTDPIDSGDTGSDTGNNPGTPTQPLQPLTIEAENMNLMGYTPEKVQLNNWSPSSDRLIKLVGDSGKASTSFSGASGKYDLLIGYYDEMDGQANVSVNHNGSQIDRWTLNANLGEKTASSKNFVERSLGELSLLTGDVIEINGVKNLEEYARIDYLKFVPATQSA